jgi:hypothetical protein
VGSGTVIKRGIGVGVTIAVLIMMSGIRTGVISQSITTDLNC